ncbi:NTP hydrolase p-loop-containing [Desulfonema limicola]|uniref:NTP hydrolase p-loop-containing n=1 Tax=Desulfonema limicola TaxID=45656 RepID=A0A975GEA9_9BACT|nr:hypothetical protein [Desulfonema limicola]QTA77910.1 NTP hydrolase p-loop-containing [Desulfonema limicola]
MNIWLEERIGNPELFTGRKNELSYFLNWIEKIKNKLSQSTAILSRRKTGKTALLQRLYNLTFEKNETVVPFYFEIRETDQWLADFAREFLLTFVFQYIAFRTRKREYLRYPKTNYSRALESVRKENLEYLIIYIEDAENADKLGNTEDIWNIARDLPRFIAEHTGERVIQMIDEFQFLNRYIFRDRACKDRIGNLAGSYLGTAEYKNAPMLVAGSWVGWLVRDILKMLPGRFQFHYLEKLPDNEAVEMILKYSHIENTPVAENIVPLMAGLAEENPFYIGSLFRTKFQGKDFTTKKGLLNTLEFETLHREGGIKGTWMEYVHYALQESNDIHAKKIVLYLSKHRKREVTRDEINKELKLEMTDSELEKKLKILIHADIIEQGSSNFFYRGVPDNIFDKVFRGVYADEIENFDPKDITNEYKARLDKLQRQINQIRGEYGRYKGAFAEFLIIHRLRHEVHKNNDLFKSTLHNLPKDFNFTEYGNIWSYHSPPLYEPEFQVDISARAKADEYSLIWEVKNRKAKFSVKEAEEFIKKTDALKKLENIEKAVLIVFSAGGFFKNTIEYLKKHGIAWTNDMKWMKNQL